MASAKLRNFVIKLTVGRDKSARFSGTFQRY